MGYEGFSGNESILYHVESPCRIAEAGEFTPIEHAEWVPDAHVHRHLLTAPIEPGGDPLDGRRCLMWNSDLEVSICRPEAEAEVFYRDGEGDEMFFVCEGSGTLETVFGSVPVPRARLRRRPARDHLPVPARRRPRRPGSASTPRARSRPRTATATATASCSSRRPTRSATSTRRPSSRPHREARRVRGPRPRARRASALHARLSPVRRRRLGRLRLPVHVQRPRLRAADRAPAPAAAGAPDVPGAELRDLLVLPARARLRPAGGADPVPPLEPAVRGGHLLRLGRVRQPQGDRDRLGHRPPLRAAARPAARPGREGARHAPDRGAGGDVGHVQAAAADRARAELDQPDYAYSWRDEAPSPVAESTTG